MQQMLNQLSKKNSNEIKLIGNPPIYLELVSKGICILLDLEPQIISNQYQKVKQYFPSFKKLLYDDKWLFYLMNFNASDIKLNQIWKLEKIIQKKEIQIQYIQKKMPSLAPFNCFISTVFNATFQSYSLFYIKYKNIKLQAKVLKRNNDILSKMIIKQSKQEFNYFDSIQKETIKDISFQSTSKHKEQKQVFTWKKQDQLNLSKISNQEIRQILQKTHPDPFLLQFAKAFCILFNIKPIIIPLSQNTNSTFLDFWSSFKINVQKDFKKLMYTLNNQTLTEKKLKELKQIVEDPSFKPSQNYNQTVDELAAWIASLVKN